MDKRLTCALLALALAGCSTSYQRLADGSVKFRTYADQGLVPVVDDHGGSSGGGGGFLGLGALFGNSSDTGSHGFAEAQTPSAIRIYGPGGEPLFTMEGVHGHSTPTHVALHESWKMLRSVTTLMGTLRGLGVYEATKLADKALARTQAELGADVTKAASADAVELARINAEKEIGLAEIGAAPAE